MGHLTKMLKIQTTTCSWDKNSGKPRNNPFQASLIINFYLSWL